MKTIKLIGGPKDGEMVQVKNGITKYFITAFRQGSINEIEVKFYTEHTPGSQFFVYEDLRRIRTEETRTVYK